MDCPNCNIRLPYRTRYFQYFKCKPCHTILVTGKERGVAFDLKLALTCFVLFSFIVVPIGTSLIVAAIASIIAVIWLHLVPPVFRVKEPAFTPPPKKKVDVSANIRRYKAEQAQKRAKRK